MIKKLMSPASRVIAAIAALLVVALAGAACAPIPLVPPIAATPAANLYAPAVEKGSGVDTSPLQPASPPAPSTEAAATAVVAATLPPTTTFTPIPPTPAPTLAGPAWQWVSSAFKDGTLLSPDDPARYTVQMLGDGNAMIQADCNFGTGTYQESGRSLSFTAIGTTKVACPADSLDGAFLAQLRNTESYTVTVDLLVLALKDKAGTMSLRAAPETEPAEAAPTNAAPTATEIVPVVPAAVPSSTSVPATQSPTAVPTATAVQQAPTQVAPTPTNPAPAQVSGGTPVPLPTPVAATVLPTLDGTTWYLVSMTVGGNAAAPVGQTPVTLAYAADGSRISGSTGCNLYRAMLGQDDSGATVVVGPALMTQEACPANVSVQEVEFMDALLQARSYVIQGNELTLIDESGNPLLVFARK
jgi:heat shock protein HslJ